MKKELVVESRSRRLSALHVHQTWVGSCRPSCVLVLRARDAGRGRGEAGPGVAIWDAASSFKWVNTSPQGSVRHQATLARTLN